MVLRRSRVARAEKRCRASRRCATRLRVRRPRSKSPTICLRPMRAMPFACQPMPPRPARSRLATVSRRRHRSPAILGPSSPAKTGKRVGSRGSNVVKRKGQSAPKHRRRSPQPRPPRHPRPLRPSRLIRRLPTTIASSTIDRSSTAMDGGSAGRKLHPAFAALRPSLAVANAGAALRPSATLLERA